MFFFGGGLWRSKLKSLLCCFFCMFFGLGDFSGIKDVDSCYFFEFENE